MSTSLVRLLEEAKESKRPKDEGLFGRLVLNEMLFSRMELMNRFKDPDPRRDLDEECGYPHIITLQQLDYMFERESLATRVVTLPPDDCWSLDPDVYETESSSITPFERAWQDLLNEHDIVHYLHRLDVESRRGHYGILLLGLDDGKNLAKRVKGISNRGEPEGKVEHKLLYLRPYRERLATIVEREQDPNNPRYGQPLYYQLQTQNLTSGNETQTTDLQQVSRLELVHWSRVIHLADGCTSDDIIGTPALQNVYNRLADVRKLLSSSAEMFYKGAFPGYSFEVPHELLGEVEMDAESLRQEFYRYSNKLQRYLAIKGVTVKQLSPQVSSPKDHLEVQVGAISMALDCPTRVFMGSEEGRLASNQDSRTWNRKLRRRQTKHLSPRVLRPVVKRFSAFGILPKVKQFFTDWPDLNAPTTEDKADVAIKMTNCLSTYVSTGVAAAMSLKSYYTMVMGWTPDEADEIIKDSGAVPPEIMKVLKLAQAPAGGDKTATPPKDRKKSGINKGGGK